MRKLLMLLTGMVSIGVALGSQPSEAAFPGANGRIAFQSVGPSGTLDIFVMEPDGGGRTNLTATGSVHEGLPAWSADGEQLAVAAASTAFPFNTEILILDAGGSTLQQLTNNPALDTFTTWSPDSSQLRSRAREMGTKRSTS